MHSTAGACLTIVHVLCRSLRLFLACQGSWRHEYHPPFRSHTTEGFGDFCARVGFDGLRQYAATYVPADGAHGAANVSHAAACLLVPRVRQCVLVGSQLHS